MDTQNTTHYAELLIRLGLTPNQTAVYTSLLTKGSQRASLLARSTGQQRALVYRTLEELKVFGLVEEDTTKPIAVFRAEHPQKLRDLLTQKEKMLADSKDALLRDLPLLSSVFNLTRGKPGVQFYEGDAGIAECLNDALTSKTEIYSYIDIAAVEKEIPEISREFAQSRQRLKLKKKNIGIDTPENRAEIEGYYTDVTEERLIPWPSVTFGTVMQIYDGKVSYFTVTNPKVGIIVTDLHIYEMHKSLFEFTWNNPLVYAANKKD